VITDNTRLWSYIKLNHKIKSSGVSSFEFSFVPLNYYYEKNKRLGSFELLSTTHSEIVKTSGLYSVYFIVIEDYFKGNLSHFRLISDEIVIKSSKKENNTSN
jgi:hypothetical protein